jgi:hypothetical protein
METVENEYLLARISGGFEIAEIEDSTSSSSITVLLKEKSYDRYLRASMEVDASNTVTSFKIQVINTPLDFIAKDDPRRESYEKALQPLTSSLREELMEELTRLIRDHYVLPEVGETITTFLQKHLEDGEYGGYKKSEDFAARLLKDLQSFDAHMLIFFQEPPPEMKMEDLPKPDIPFTGFGNVSIDTTSVPGKRIASLPINAFIPSDSEEARKKISETMSSISDADALIIDLRANRGGRPETVSYILSFLLPGGPVHILDFVDHDGVVKQSFHTLGLGELPDDAKVFGKEKPVYVLTSKETVSGGEDMAYALQGFGRAMVVGDERTAGAANVWDKVRWIGEERFGKWWMVGIPGLRPVSKATGGNWEGTGVRSDVVLGNGEDAEDVAKRLVARDLGVDREL